jgi:hypothetical protein
MGMCKPIRSAIFKFKEPRKFATESTFDRSACHRCGIQQPAPQKTTRPCTQKIGTRVYLLQGCGQHASVHELGKGEGCSGNTAVSQPVGGGGGAFKPAQEGALCGGRLQIQHRRERERRPMEHFQQRFQRAGPLSPHPWGNHRAGGVWERLQDHLERTACSSKGTLLSPRSLPSRPRCRTHGTCLVKDKSIISTF